MQPNRLLLDGERLNPKLHRISSILINPKNLTKLAETPYFILGCAGQRQIWNCNGSFRTHPVFTRDECVDFFDRETPRSAKARESLLTHHRKRGRQLRLEISFCDGLIRHQQ
jgi:hypothetical protein